MMPVAYRGCRATGLGQDRVPLSGVNRLRKRHSGPAQGPSLAPNWGLTHHRQELCDSLYLDDGHTLIVVDAPAEGQADAAGVFRSLASMDVYVRARR